MARSTPTFTPVGKYALGSLISLALLFSDLTFQTFSSSRGLIQATGIYSQLILTNIFDSAFQFSSAYKDKKDLIKINQNLRDEILMIQNKNFLDEQSQLISQEILKLQENLKEINGDRVDINNDIDAMFEVMEERSRTIGDYEGSDNIVYRVQVGAYKYELSEDIFTGLDDLLVLFGEDGLTRYMTESFRNTEDANQRKQELLVEGFEDAFMTAYSNGSRIELPSSGNGVMPKEEILLMMTKIILVNLN